MDSDADHPSTADVFRTKQQLAYDAIRRSILSLSLKPGQRLIIGDLARSIGVSANPVREALSRLEAEGLVHTVPHMGATVAGFTPEAVEERYRIRGVLAGYAMRSAASILIEEQLTEARELLDQMDESVRANELDRWQYLNNHFHDALLAMCSMPQLVLLINMLKRQGPSYRYFPDYIRVLASESQSEHHKLMVALLHGDGDEAEVVMRSHYSRAGVIFKTYLASQLTADADEHDRRARAHPENAPGLPVAAINSLPDVPDRESLSIMARSPLA